MYNKNTRDKVLNDLIKNHEKQIYKVSSRILLKNSSMSEADIRNVIQITCLYMVKRLKKEPLLRKNCLGYFITCLRFRCYDYLKKHMKHNMANIDKIDENDIKLKL